MICPIEWRDKAATRAPSLAHLTDWIDGTQAPVRVGYYERHFTDSLIICDSVQYWDGEAWMWRPGAPPHWRQVGDYPAWRGITEEQAKLRAAAGISTLKEKA